MDMSFSRKINEIVKKALSEDVGSGDVTTKATISSSSKSEAVILCKQDGLLAGSDIAKEVFRQVDSEITVRFEADDGDKIKANRVIAYLSGPTRGILTAERTALNFLQRFSGIATLTARFVEAVKGTKAIITDTRKTTPGLRMFEKYAVRMGGGVNHRMGLYDMILIKDNHEAACGSISKAVGAAKKSNPGLKIEVECKSTDDVKEALSAIGVDRIMLDNMTLAQMRRAVKMASGRIEIEASGGVNLRRVRSVAETGVGFISIGALTHSAPSLDISLDIMSLKK
jgi:nicotinate-nucleotide pyrophosphorylase (carboxylating)